MLTVQANVHVTPETTINVHQQDETGTHVVLLSTSSVYPYVAVNFRDVDDLRRLRDALDVHLVGRLDAPTEK